MRKIRAKDRILLVDPKYKSEDVTRFVNIMMFDGKKSVAYKIFYTAMDIIAEKTKEDPIEIWQKAIDNVSPQVEVRSRRVGGSTFQIPTQIRDSRKKALAIKNIISFSRKRNEKTMGQKLAGELMSASKEEGASFKKKEEIHRMAQANKAFSHFRI